MESFLGAGGEVEPWKYAAESVLFNTVFALGSTALAVVTPTVRSSQSGFPALSWDTGQGAGVKVGGYVRDPGYTPALSSVLGLTLLKETLRDVVTDYRCGQTAPWV